MHQIKVQMVYPISSLANSLPYKGSYRTIRDGHRTSLQLILDISRNSRRNNRRKSCGSDGNKYEVYLDMGREYD